jgi:hypothetical protein
MTSLLEDLTALGETKQEVHDRLLALGLKGEPGEDLVAGCPVMEYLRLNGYRDVDVREDGAFMASGHPPVPAPKPVTEFIVAFDDWEYLDLVRKGVDLPCPHCAGRGVECGCAHGVDWGDEAWRGLPPSEKRSTRTRG